MSHRELKILMLHGHEQSAQIFKPKARYIQQAFDAFAAGYGMTCKFHFLSGILPARPDRSDDNDHWVWGYGDPDDGEIKKIELSVKYILDTLVSAQRLGRPFDGIVGFSSGAAMAAIIASLLEKKGKPDNLPLKIHHPKLKFILCLSGFRLGSTYDSIYSPAITTPALLTIGAYDPVIVPAQTRALADHCQGARVFEFDGTHYVPQFKEFPSFCTVLASFLRDVLVHPPRSKAICMTDLNRALIRQATPISTHVKKEFTLNSEVLETDIMDRLAVGA